MGPDSQRLLLARTRRRRRRQWVRVLLLPAGLAALLALGVLALESIPGLAAPREVFGDLVQRARRVEVSRQIALIEFDQHPVPKQELARAIEIAARGGARAILLDVLLDREHLLDGPARAALERALAAAPQAVAPYVVRERRPLRSILPGARREPEGYVNLWVDPDGVVRRSGRPASGELPRPLQSAAFRALQVAGLTLPDGPLRISYPAAERFAGVRLAGRALPLLRDPGRFFAGRIVLIGYVSPDPLADPYDLVRTPVDERYPGLYVHAATINTVLQRNELASLPRAAQTAVVFAALLLLLHVTLLTRVRLRPGWRSGLLQAAEVLGLCVLYLAGAALLAFELQRAVWTAFPFVALLAARPLYPGYRRVLGELVALRAAYRARRHPTFLARGYVEMQRFADPFARLNAMVSLVVGAVRWNAIQAVALALDETRELGPGHRKRRRIRGILTSHLRRPTLGNWIRLACQLTEKIGAGSRLEPFRATYQDSQSRAMLLLDGVQSRDFGQREVGPLGLLALRNRLRHGARSTMTPAECRAIFDEYRDDAEQLLMGLLPQLDAGALEGALGPPRDGRQPVRRWQGVWPRRRRRQADLEPGRIYLIEEDGRPLDLFPLVLMRRCLVHGRQELFFYERGLAESDVPPELRWGFEGPSLHCLPQVDTMLEQAMERFAESIWKEQG